MKNRLTKTGSSLHNKYGILIKLYLGVCLGMENGDHVVEKNFEENDYDDIILITLPHWDESAIWRNIRVSHRKPNHLRKFDTDRIGGTNLKPVINNALIAALQTKRTTIDRLLPCAGQAVLQCKVGEAHKKTVAATSVLSVRSSAASTSLPI